MLQKQYDQDVSSKTGDDDTISALKAASEKAKAVSEKAQAAIDAATKAKKERELAAYRQQMAKLEDKQKTSTSQTHTALRLHIFGCSC